MCLGPAPNSEKQTGLQKYQPAFVSASIYLRACSARPCVARCCICTLKFRDFERKRIRSQRAAPGSCVTRLLCILSPPAAARPPAAAEPSLTHIFYFLAEGRGPWSLVAFYLPVPAFRSGLRVAEPPEHSPVLRGMRGQRSPERRHPRGCCASPHPERASSFDFQPFLKTPSPAGSHKEREKHSRLRFSSAGPGTCRSPGVSGAGIAENSAPTPAHTRSPPFPER